LTSSGTKEAVMNELIEKIAFAVEKGKINRLSPYPPAMKGEDGADELTVEALRQGVKPTEIIEACKLAMDRIGKKFSDGIVFVPELLMASKANAAVMVHLRPYFLSGEVKRKGVFIIGTVTGDLHDIGKNLVCMMLEGAAFDVVDLGVDVSPEKFVEAVRNSGANIVAMSALLTTTMPNMKTTIEALREAGVRGKVKVMVGGAPLTDQYAKEIGADGYAPDASRAVVVARSLSSKN
jgi:methylmalonyl-CoA mutase cobalamin-binding domain/chain